MIASLARLPRDVSGGEAAFQFGPRRPPIMHAAGKIDRAEDRKMSAPKCWHTSNRTFSCNGSLSAQGAVDVPGYGLPRSCCRFREVC